MFNVYLEKYFAVKHSDIRINLQRLNGYKSKYDLLIKPISAIAYIDSMPGV